METSVVITTFNEEHSISFLLDSLLAQSQKPTEIVIVDSKSKDKTIEIIRHYQKKDKSIKLLIQECTRGKGRNIGIELARHNIIAITDAGCVAQVHWLERITSPFENRDVGAVAGFYKMTGSTNFQSALAVFLGVVPDNFDVNFLPSTRSFAVRKSVWEEVGGFPENINTAEDTVFNQKLLQNSVKISRMKSAKVEWGMPNSLSKASSKFYHYAKGDAKSRIWKFKNSLASHNIKVLSIFFRYILLLVLLFFSFSNPLLLLLVLLLLLAYIFWAFRKVYLHTGSFNSATWGPVIQIISDFSVMAGFVSAYIKQ